MAVRNKGPDGTPQLRDNYQEMPTGHAEALIPMLDALMKSAGLKFEDVRRLAVTSGPGSFTGARIGLSAARGLRLALGVPVVTLTSLMVMALRAELLIQSGHFPVERKGAAMAVAVDARGGNVYAEVFGADVSELVVPARLTTPAALAQELGGRRVIAVGSGSPMLAEAITAAGGEAVAILPQLQPHARHLAMLADAAPLDTVLTPLYLRETDAKPMAAP